MSFRSSSLNPFPVAKKREEKSVGMIFNIDFMIIIPTSEKDLANLAENHSRFPIVSLEILLSGKNEACQRRSVRACLVSPVGRV